MLTVFVRFTRFVDTVNEALVSPASTVTVAGTETREESPLATPSTSGLRRRSPASAPAR
jgi:hypothetical protein